MAVATNEVYTWAITYYNGTEVKEFDTPDSTGHDFSGVDHAKVNALHLLPVRFGSTHVVTIPEDATPLFFRRRRATFDLMSNSGGTAQGVIHCIGWNRGDQSVYLFVWEDGSSLLTEDLQAV